MSLKAYQSNISPLWPQSRQDEMFMKHFEGAKAFFPPIFSDDITKGDRRAKRVEVLVERHQLFRPSTRTGGTIFVAALPCLAYDTDDFIFVLKQAADKSVSIHVLDTGMIFKPCKSRVELNRAKDIFAETKAKAKGFENGQLGGQTSAANKRAKLLAAAEIARPYWHLDEPSNIALSKMAGASVNSLKEILGLREDARRKYKTAQKRKAKREAKG